MKVKLISLLTITLLAHELIYSQNVSINASGTAANADAMLDVSSTTSGLLIPRMTQAQRNAINSGTFTQSLLIYQTDGDSGFYYHDGSNWVPFLTNSVGATGGWSLKGNTGTTVGTHFLGTTDAEDFAIYTNNSERIRIDQNGNIGIGTTSPGRRLEIYSESEVAQEDDILLTGRLESASSNPAFVFQKQKTTGGYLTDGSEIGELLAAAYNGTNIGNGVVGGIISGIRFIADGNHASGDLPSGMIFYTTPAGSASLTERMRITSAGSVGIGTTTPGNIRLRVHQEDILPVWFERENSSSGASLNNVLQLRSSHSSGVGAAGLGTGIGFYTESSTEGTYNQVAQIEAYQTDATAGAEDSDLYLKVFNSGAAVNDALVIKSNGNVGIGTTTSAALLQIGSPSETENLMLSLQSGPTVGDKNDGGLLHMYNDHAPAGTRSKYLRVDTLSSLQVRNSARNTTLFHVEDAGNVGIGTTNPQQKLHSTGVIRTDDRLEDVDGVASGGFNMISASNLLHIDVGGSGHSTDRIHLGDISNPDNNVTTFGNIGIGITAPTADLVLGNDIIRFDATNAISTTPDVFFKAGGFIGADDALWLVSDGDNDGSGAVVFGSSGSNTTGASEHARFTTAGNLGIGTTSPDEILHITEGTSGSNPPMLRIQAKTEANTTGGQFYSGIELGVVGGENSSGGQEVTAYVKAVDTRTPSTSNEDGGLAFGTLTQAEANPSTKMTLTNNGDLGIGTTTPGGQLELSLDEGRKPSTTLWTTTSDERLKTITGSYQKGLQEILSLSPIVYRYKNVKQRIFPDEVLEKVNVGFSAQKVREIFPECVGIDEDGFLNLNPHAIVIAYVNAIKELNAKIDAQQQIIENQNSSIGNLKAENEALKAKGEALEIRLEEIEQYLKGEFKKIE